MTRQQETAADRRNAKEPDLPAGIAPIARQHSLRGALLVSVVVFLVLWLANIPYRQVYQPSHDDITALADGLLLRPGAQWQDWFTRGHSDFFDPYPEWPWGQTAFARPVFQFVIYLAHFIFGRDWASYLAINYLSVAGVAAVAYAIARVALGLGAGLSSLTAVLVLLSSAVLEFSIGVVGAGSEPFASFLVGCAFLGVVARRDLLCAVFLLAAVLTKETAIWAPFAAALTVPLRPSASDARDHRVLATAVMLLPVALWLGLRFTFFGGIGGTYATTDYTPVAEFLQLAGWKLAHLHDLFVTQNVGLGLGRPTALDRAIRIGTAAAILLLLTLWVIGGLRETIVHLRLAAREGRRPTADASLLVTLWAALSLGFFFALALASARYAASAAMFVWPAVVAEVARSRKAVVGFCLAACTVMSLVRAGDFVTELNRSPARFRAAAAMNTALSQMPLGIKQVYVLPVGGLPGVNSEYLRALLGVRAEIIRIADISWNCSSENEGVTFDRATNAGAVDLEVRLPDCARFLFDFSSIDANALSGGHIRRNDSITYDVPEAQAIARGGSLPPALEIGHRMIVHVRPRDPARFIVEHSPDGGIAWFDVP